MKIICINKFHWLKGGSETAYFSLMKIMEEYGHEVAPFSMQDIRNLPTSYGKHFIENVSFDEGGLVKKLSAALKIIYNWDARSKMEGLIKTFHPDVAHFHIFQHQISPSVFGPLKKNGVPLVLTLHDLKPICPNYKMLTHGDICERCKGGQFIFCAIHRCSKESLLKSCLNTIEMYIHYMLRYYQEVDRYIAVSNFYRKKMIEFGFSPEKIVHIPNSVDASRFPVMTYDGGYGIFFGRLSVEKGVITLLRALAKRPEISFVIVGTGPMENELKCQAASLGLKNITFTGFKSGSDLYRLIAEASFSVIPSEWYENCPMSVLESFAMGRAVIGASIGGIPELIEDEVDGLIFESGNADALAERMWQLWTNPVRRREMGMAGRMKIQTEYTPRLNYEQTVAVYEELILR